MFQIKILPVRAVPPCFGMSFLLLVRGLLSLFHVVLSRGTYQAIGDRMPQNLETGYKATITRVLRIFLFPILLLVFLLILVSCFRSR